MSHYAIYSRKSLEDEEDQVQSIPSQQKEMGSLAARLSVSIVRSFEEAKSAKAPGRPVFDAMMKQVEGGQIEGILCWKLDRLARNPVDGGRIIWAIKQHGLIIQTPHQSFSMREDNLILMYIEFGMAQKYVDDLSRNTMRGLKAKAEKGWFPSVAPMGYLNSKTEERGNKTILSDPNRFQAVRRMWDLMLTGNYSPAQIRKTANDEWGFRTRLARRTGGKPVSRSTMYKMFSDPFYRGKYEYPKGSGQWYQGRHTPMVSDAEFSRVQFLLHRDSNPRPHKEFAMPFRGLLKCGECGSCITAHVKEQVRCPRCRYKSSLRNRSSCAKCRLSLDEMPNPQIRHYVYYHCTRTLNSACREPSVAADTLARQLEEKLPSFGLSQELRNWGQECLDELRKGDLDQAQQIILERKRAYEHCIARMENLLNLKTAPENTDGSLLSDEEYQKQRIALLAQKKSLAYDTPAFEAELEGKTQVIASALDLATAIQANPGGDLTTLTNTLRALGSNHCLKSKELEIKPDFPFSELHRGETQAPSQLIRIEPDSSQAAQAPERGWRPRCPSTVPGSDDDRTISLKVSIKNIWERLKPGDPLIARFPYNNETSPVPRRRKPWTIRHRTFSKFGSVEPLGRGGISRRQGSEPTQ